MFAAAGCVAVVVLIAAAAGGVVAALFGTSGQDPSCAAATVTLQPAARDPAPEGPAARGPAPEGPAGLTAEQARNAAVIVAVGRRLGVPVRGWVVAVATALQESGLINSGTATNADSLGLFQQRPSQGWGTLAQIMEPAYASAAFYTALHRVPHWQTLPLTVAAQTVQRSAYPDAYADDEPRAAAIVASYTGGVVCDGGDGPSGAGLSLPAGFTLPADTPAAVVVAIGWALAQRGTPYAFGGDCTAPRSGEPAHACDCSSLVMAAYRAGSIGLPRVTGDQVHAGTPVVGLADLKPGDLIFIPGSGGSRDRPEHVGLYIGGGLLVQAPHTGDVVKVSAVSGWANDVAAIRRIVPQ
jgi:cell wall-associated NlpC family hydrolase